MNTFKTSVIIENNQIIAKELKRSRLEKKVSLQDASKHLKMNIKYLEALEAGDFDVLPTGVYKINFLREYALFLGLSGDELTELFKLDKVKTEYGKQSELFVKKATHLKYLITVPKLIKNFLIISAALICFVYLAFGINAIVSPPSLVVSSPNLDTVTDKKEILVAGQTVPEAEITINDELVLADKNGSFEKKVNLKKGLNTIVIVSQKKYSRKNEQIKKILVSDG